uniref:Glycosyltransferase n=1 Tax=viral metagenome TaxID=1070528 RepID=A0A6C0BNK1_9ZZZZ
MRVLFLTFQDYANVSTDICAALNEHIDGWEAKVCSCHPHPFVYANKHDLDYDHATTKQKDDLKAWVEQGVDIVVWANEANPRTYYDLYHTSRLFRDTLSFQQWERIPHKFIFHAGNSYRTYAGYFNDYDQSQGIRQLVSPDLWRLALPEAQILFGKPIPFAPQLRHAERRLVVGHSPTNYYLKGSGLIEKAVRALDVEYRQLGGPLQQGKSLPHAELAKRRADCDIYIDQFSTVGGLGVSSLEAMAQGILVLCSTQMIPDQLWTAASIPKPPIIHLPTPTGCDKIDILALRAALEPWVKAGVSRVANQGKAGQHWVRQYFEPQVFAERFVGLLTRPVHAQQSA